MVFKVTGDLTITNAIITTVCAMLGVVFVVVTYRTRASEVATINTVESWITLAKSIVADSVTAAVMSTGVHAEYPHITENTSF